MSLRFVASVAVAWTMVGACAPQAAAPQPSSVALTPVALGPVPSPSPDLGDLDEEIGSLLVVSWQGTAIPPSLVALMEQGRVGGVLLFGSNFNGPAGLKALSDDLTALAARSCLGHPILVMLDEEGGQVNRVQAPFAPPSELAAGLRGAENVRSLERASAAGLRSLGVGLNLAPVADVRTNPHDQVILDRSFGARPSVVAPLVAAAVTGLHEGGVGATLKHFPGLGGAAGDPHVAIPTDRETEATWEAVQMPGFRAGILAGADAVMTTAVYVPGLGGGRTAAMFSPAIVGRLRTELGFGGVIVSDSVSMGGVGALYSLPAATVLALGAGNDMVLLGNSSAAYEQTAMSAVRDAVDTGRLSRVAIHASAMRVNALRDKWGRRFTRCRVEPVAL